MSRARIKPYLGALVCALALTAATEGHAQSASALEGRIADLERQVVELERLAAGASGPDGPVQVTRASALTPEEEINLPAAARLTVRLDELERSMGRLTGRIEEMQFELSRLQTQFATFSDDVEFRFQAQGGDAAAGLAPQPGAGSEEQAALARERGTAGDPTAPQVLGTVPLSALSGSDVEDFRTAFGYMKRGDFAGAEAAFRRFIETYPNSDLAGSAYYWLGESLFARQQYGEAAAAFLKGARDHPNGDKAPDSLLKLGLSLGELGQSTEACSAFDELRRLHPDASERIQQNAQRARRASGCA
jgi:tol-pal system protein YbgF